jgi:hypothetical protein
MLLTHKIKNNSMKNSIKPRNDELQIAMSPAAAKTAGKMIEQGPNVKGGSTPRVRPPGTVKEQEQNAINRNQPLAIRPEQIKRFKA